MHPLQYECNEQTIVHVLCAPLESAYSRSVSAKRASPACNALIDSALPCNTQVSLVSAVFFVLAHRRSLAMGHEGCAGWPAFVVSTAFNASLLGLFVDFYLKSYKAKKKDKKKDKKK